MKTSVVLSYLLVIILLASGCSNENKEEQPIAKQEINLAEYQEKGQTLASSTQKVLASNLINAIEEQGAEHSLEFCNIRAIPLTDSMSTVLNAHIKRVTDQPRNPDNQANKVELAYMEEAKSKLKNTGEIQPILIQHDGKVTAYYPIIINQLCMQCHGKESQDINKTTLAKINNLYPNDEATGYVVGELRGLWVVEMEPDD